MTIAETFAKTFLDSYSKGSVGAFIEAQNLPYFLIKVPNERDDSRNIALLLFSDASGFFTYLETEWEAGDIVEPWFYEDRYFQEGQIFQIEQDLITPELQKHLNLEIAYPVFYDEDGCEEVLSAAAKACTNAPEGLIEYIVKTESPFQWNVADSEDVTIILLAQAAHLVAGRDVSFFVHSSNKEGRTPGQETKDLGMLKFLQLLQLQNHDTFAGSEYLYKGAAYCSFDYDNMPGVSYHELSSIEHLLAAVSSMILTARGEPTGWVIEYNDGAYEKMSGYSADQKAESFSTKMLSAHERMSAKLDLASIFRDPENQTAILAAIEKAKCPDHPIAALVRGLCEPEPDRQ